MSRRAKSEEAPISLFSFQDLITSITGIMILVVLLLILELITQKPPSPQSSQSRPTSPDTKTETVAKLEAQLAEEKALYNTLIDKTRIDSPKSSPTQKAASESEKNRQLRQQIARIEADLNSFRDEQRKTDFRPDSAKDKAQKVISELEKALSDLKAEVQSMEKTKNELETQIAKKKNKVVVTIDRDDNLVPILLECSGAGVRVIDVRGKKILNTLKVSGFDYQDLIASFSTYIATQLKPNRDHLVFCIKASSTGYASSLVAIAGKHKFECGMEPLAEDVEVVF